MDISTAFLLLGMMSVSCVIAIVSLRTYAFTYSNHGSNGAGFMDKTDRTASFLFEDEILIDANDPAHELLSGAQKGVTDLEQLIGVLVNRFLNIKDVFEGLPETSVREFQSNEGNSRLIIEWLNGMTRLTVHGFGENTGFTHIEKHCYDAMEREIETLRTTAEVAPFLVWREQQDGTVSWANNAYIAIAHQFQPDLAVKSWPPSRIFAKNEFTNITNNTALRLSTQLPKEAEPRWFEYTQTPINDGFLYTAVSVDKTVKAEGALRDFTQTLAKTFAHLKVGLAIFDKQRQLVIFNPALTDLAELPVEFLLQRPTLHTFLDRLREKRMIPEQRDYITWRRRLFELETAAENGTYEETWSLATGQTYRVTGHPHSDSALAFLMEDISAEISLTRRFRRELGTGQAVFDNFDEAIAVFSAGGNLTLSNIAYSRLRGVESCDTIGGSDIAEATRAWGTKCSPTSVWDDARAFVCTMGERVQWTAEVRLVDGRLLSCRFAPLAGGSTLAGFSFRQPVITQFSKNQFTATQAVLETMPG